MDKFRKVKSHLDKSIDAMRNFNDVFEDDIDLKTGEERNIEIEDLKNQSKKKDSFMSEQKRRFYLFWMIVLFVLPPPFGTIILKVNKVKLRWYHYLLVINIFGFVGIIFLLQFVMMPLQMRLHTATVQAKKLFIEYNLAQEYGMDTPTVDFNFEGGSTSSNPDYEGTLAIDYDLLEQKYPGDNEAKVRAQRYQLYSEIEQIIGTPLIWMYNVEGQESAADDLLQITDLYKCYTASNLGSMGVESSSGFSHSLGPFQISSAGKHLPIMFESKYSTRQSNSTTELYGFHRLHGGKDRSSSADGTAYYDSFKAKDANPTLDLTSIYDPNVDDLTSVIKRMSENIERNSKSGDFDSRVLTVEGTKDYVTIRGNGKLKVNSFINPSLRSQYVQSSVYNSYGEAQTPYLLRWNPYYYPDAAASTAYDIVWVTNTLKTLVSTGNTTNSTSAKGTIIGSTPLTKTMRGSSTTYKDYFLNLTDSQQQEVGALFCLSWFNGIPNQPHRDDMFMTALEALAQHGTMTAWDNKYTYNGRTYVLFKEDKNGKIVQAYGRMKDAWMAIPGAYGFKTYDSRGYDYAFKALGQGYHEMMKDKEIFEEVKMVDYNGSTNSTTGYQKIIELDWSDAHTMFPRYDQGGPGKMECIDVRTGKEFTLMRTVGTKHADCEPETKTDTNTLKEIFGKDWESGRWVKRPILIKGNEGKLYAASMCGEPHAGKDNVDFSGANLDYIKGNGTNGVIDVHFRGSTKHIDAEYGVTEATPDPSHQECITEASKSDKYINNESVGEGNPASSGAQYTFKNWCPPVWNATLGSSRGWDPSQSHYGYDLTITAHFVDKKDLEPGDKTRYKQSVKPTIKIHAPVAGVVTRVKCHSPAKTGKTPSWDKGQKEASDHSKTTINRTVQGLSYPEKRDGDKWYQEGDCVYIKSDLDGDEYMLLHMWCGSITVKEGDRVELGQVVGYMGNTGWTEGSGNNMGASGVHLHLQRGPGKSHKQINSEWNLLLGASYSD